MKNILRDPGFQISVLVILLYITTMQLFITMHSQKPVVVTSEPAKVVIYDRTCERECCTGEVCEDVEDDIVVESETEINTASYEEIDPIVYFDIPLEKDLQDHIFDLCEKYEIDPVLIFAIAKRETQFNHTLMGDNGNSYGLMQVQPKWHQGRMDELGVTDLMNPYQNVEVAIDYLADLFEYDKSLEWTLMAYNAGPTGANKNEKKGIVSEYVTIVKQYAEEIEGSVIYG